MSTGKQRLEDKHAGKRQKVVRIPEDFFEKQGKSVNMVQNDGKKAKISQLKRENLIKSKLNEHERLIFDTIYEDIQKIHTVEHEKYILAACNLAKLYAQQDILEETLNVDGYVQEDKNGRMYSHPAATLLQRVQASIIANLRALGLTLGKAQVKEAENNQNAESEFANFQ